jgi:flagellar export protein FliJ
MNSFATLIKLQKTRVDEQRQFLAKLLEHLEAIERAIAEHEIRQAREQLAIQENPAAAMTYGAFVKWAVDHARNLERQYVTVAKAVDLARGKLAELFEEQKRYEIAEADRLEELRREELRQETIELDEIGSVGFIRKHKKGKR